MPSGPWFKLYASDLLLDDDLFNLDPAAEGILLRMWCLCWRDGYCPSDPAELALKIRRQQLHVQKHYTAIARFFVQTSDGKLISTRMEAERQRSGQVSEARRLAAKSMHDKKKGSVTPANAPANAHAKPLHSESESESEKNKNISSKPSGFDLALDEVFQYFLVTLNKNPTRYRLTEKRRRKGMARLKECYRLAKEPKLENAISMMKVCIERFADSPFHNGNNDNGKKYLDFETLFRSEEKLGWWVDDKNHRGSEVRQCS